MARFKIGDRVRTHHTIPDYDGKEGVVTREYSVVGGSWWLQLDSREPIGPYVMGVVPYSEDYLEYLGPLSPFEQRVKDYIDKELRT